MTVALPGAYALEMDPRSNEPITIQGSCGVFLCFGTDNSVEPSRRVAIKTVPLAPLSKIQRLQFEREPILLGIINRKLTEVLGAENRTLLDKFVVLHAVHEAPASLTLVMEAMDGDLLGWLVPTRGMGMRALDEATIAGIVFEVLVGIAVLHHTDIAHRDLKFDNVLYRRDPATGNMTFKLADFGLAKMISGTSSKNTPCGTPMYVAPEVVAAFRKRNLLLPEQEDATIDVKATDMWSLGVMLYVMLIRKPIDRDVLVRRAKLGTLFDPSWCRNGVSQEAQDLVEALLDLEPSERHTAGKAGMDPFFRKHGFDFGQVSTALTWKGGPIQGAAPVVPGPANEAFEPLPEGSDPAADLAGINQEPAERN